MSEIHVFTDGACSGNPGPAGVGVVLYYNEHKKEISKFIGNATNNIAELTAIKIGLEAIKSTYRNLPVIIYTDSAYSLKIGIQKRTLN
jgi:ribonuclease HI